MRLEPIVRDRWLFPDANSAVASNAPLRGFSVRGLLVLLATG